MYSLGISMFLGSFVWARLDLIQKQSVSHIDWTRLRVSKKYRLFVTTLILIFCCTVTVCYIYYSSAFLFIIMHQSTDGIHVHSLHTDIKIWYLSNVWILFIHTEGDNMLFPAFFRVTVGQKLFTSRLSEETFIKNSI